MSKHQDRSTLVLRTLLVFSAGFVVFCFNRFLLIGQPTKRSIEFIDHTTKENFNYKIFYQEEEEQEQEQEEQEQARAQAQVVQQYITHAKNTAENGCTLLTNATHHRAKIRFIVFQRDTAEQLHDLIVHYSQVVPLDSLVVIDHLGENERTKKILKYYGSEGMHVWRCEKEWTLKDQMWTSVVQVYKDTSDFVFPIDVDEYLAVRTYDGHAEGRKKAKSKLVWTREALDKELDMLLEKYDGRPFKTWWTTPIPTDCPSLSYVSESDESYHISSNSFSSKLCCISEAVEQPQTYCMAKVFTKGSAYIYTDTGNHYGATTDMKGKEELKPACQRYMKDRKYPNPYFQTNLSLLHMQDLTFHDWVMHHMRGASSYGYNKLGKEIMGGCEGLNGGTHYCQHWAVMADSNFDYWEMKSLFLKKRCFRSAQRRLVSIAGLFPSLCG
jgi:hypothetical protein